MAQTALFTRPMARKKPVPTKYDPNSYRVISQEAEVSLENRPNVHSTFSGTGFYNVIGQDFNLRPSSEHRHNRPNPRNVNFLRQDVRLLNEPVCNVGTSSTQDVQHQWWPHRTSNEPLNEPQYTFDSTMRDDFRSNDADAIMRQTRHGCNPEKQPVQGAVPVNFLRKPDGKQRFWKEGISYEHQYNSRLDPQYPVRSKRHGAFVWDEFPPEQVNKMLHEFGYISDKLQQTDTYANVNNSGKSSRRTSGSSNRPKDQPSTSPLQMQQNYAFDKIVSNEEKPASVSNGLSEQQSGHNVVQREDVPANNKVLEGCAKTVSASIRQGDDAGLAPVAV